MNQPLDITIVIPMKNEARGLVSCLQAIGKNFVREIVIIDSNSSDGTQKIAIEHGVTVINFDWNGQYPKKRNWYLQNFKIVTTWVLFLDVDEIITEDFKEDLRKTLGQSPKEIVGYWLSYSIYFMGKRLKAGYPLNKLALFKFGAGYYEKIEEDHWSNLDMEIHEHPILNGKVGHIKSKIEHSDYKGIFHYINKHNEYARWEAKRVLVISQKNEVKKIWTWKQRVKYFFIQTPLLGPFYFLGSFFLMLGFLDGKRGFLLAVLKMSYFIQVYIYIQEFKNQTKHQ